MGLATAQARLLTITARKSDCEFLSMSYSHQKIALSRNMEKVSTEYQNALNQTKLVYDYTGHAYYWRSCIFNNCFNSFLLPAFFP